MKQYLNDLAVWLDKKGEQYNDKSFHETAKEIRERAGKVQDFVPSDQTNDNEPPPPGIEVPKKPPPP